MAIKLGVHVLTAEGDKGFISAILGDACEVTLTDGRSGTCAADSLKVLRGRPRKLQPVATAVEAAPEAEGESCDSASV